MNARQKVKRLKAELKALKSMPVPVIKEYYGEVKRYKVKQTVETEYLCRMSADAESPQTYINRALARQLAETLLDEVEFTVVPSVIPEHTEITGEIAIVTKGIATQRHLALSAWSKLKKS